MKKNVGSIDKLIRIAIALALTIMYLTNVVTGVLGMVSLVVAVIFLATSLINFCPIYALLGTKTCKTS